MDMMSSAFGKRVKILATLGPASASRDGIAALLDAGADAFRINFSHGDHETHRQVVALIRQIEAERGHPVTILADLQGPKFRIGQCPADGLALTQGGTLNLIPEGAAADIVGVPLPHPEIFAAVQMGNRVLFDDGRIAGRVIAHDACSITLSIEIGGLLKSNKGVSLPDCHIPVSAMTPKDERDLEAALSWGVDWIALSFVQTAEDVVALKGRVAGRAAIMAKIEKPLALEQIEAIVAVADGVMVARGDLGVELPPEAVPAAQKRIVSVARRAGIPVVVATQMLESMIENPVPTRAEVSDVATAIYDGVDAIMLSAETATGAHPALAVEMMSKVARSVNADPEYAERVHFTKTAAGQSVSDAISAAATAIVETVGAKATVCFTTSGSTAMWICRERPSAPVIVLTPSKQCARRLGLLWGSHVIETKQPASFEDVVRLATTHCQSLGLCTAGDLLAITAGVPFGKVGSTNVVHVTQIGEDPFAFR